MASAKEPTQIGKIVLSKVKTEQTILDDAPQDVDPMAQEAHEPIFFDHFLSVGSLSSRKGQRTSNSKKIFSCDKCDYRTEYKCALKRHKMTHSGSKPFACSMCDYRSYHPQTLKSHMMKHNGSKPFACRMCGYRSYHPQSLKTHMMKHNDFKPFACNMCDYRAGLAEFLDKHMEIHNCQRLAESLSQDIKMTEDDLATPCPSDYLEGVEITEEEGIKEETDITPPDARPFGCGLCDYGAQYITHLQEHLKAQHGVS